MEETRGIEDDIIMIPDCGQYVVLVETIFLYNLHQIC